MEHGEPHQEPIKHPDEFLPDGNAIVDGEIKPAADFLEPIESIDGGSSDDEYEPDETLFDEPEEEPHFVHDAAAIAVRAMDHLPHKKYPQSVQDVIAARNAKAARATYLPEREDAQAELGGRSNRPDYDTDLPRDEVLKNVLAEYQDWHFDIKEAVERFGVVEFTRRELTSMDDFETYSLHFYNYMELIQASIRQIKSTEGHVEHDEYLRGRYPGRTPEEMNAYRSTLEWLMYELVKTGIPASICRALEPEYGQLEWSDGELKHDAIKANRRKAIKGFDTYKRTHKKYPHVQVVSVNGKPHLDHVV